MRHLLLPTLATLAVILGSCSPEPEATSTSSPFATASPSPAATQPRLTPTATPAANSTPASNPTTAPSLTPAPAGTPAPSPPPTAIPSPANPGYAVERIFPNLEFKQATGIEHSAVAGADRLFVLEQDGRILTFPNTADASQTSVFLDIRPKVYTAHNEEGLLGLAFDPAFSQNGYFYVYYSADGPRRNVLSRFTVTPDRARADPATELVILQSPKPFGNHNGGQILFGPDGFLYIGIGDGGGSGDPEGHGQSTADLLGSILRIDVRQSSAQAPYAIPPDNPFAGQAGARPEIWAYGLRNPWRFSFDATGRLWIADVGQFNREEIDIGQKGANYGWPITEGTRCYSRNEAACARTELVRPIWEYDHDEGCSITGGYVVRDPRLRDLAGSYVFADFCSGKIWALRYDDRQAAARELLDTSLGITTFGEGPDGTLYIVSRSQGLYRLAGSG